MGPVAAGPLGLKVCKVTGWRPAGGGVRNFFIFILFFFHLSKIYVVIFFLQICHPAAGSFGGNEIPTDEPAAGPA